MIIRERSLAHKLAEKNWFQSFWLAGGLVFLVNASLFFAAALLANLLFVINIPYVHNILMISVVIVSLYVWSVCNRAWSGSKRNRLKLGLIGSSFYLGLFCYSSFQYFTVKPSYPGEDTFMMTFAWLAVSMTTIIAALACFIFTGFSKADHTKK